MIKTQEELAQALETVDLLTDQEPTNDNGWILLGAMLALHWALGHSCPAAQDFDKLLGNISRATGVNNLPPIKGGH